ncbi:MAG: hypothetical protein JWL77_305 [Chthonomonadaceae bacterium]|nr:hypothetical protein [Chthonomonadaceae bacterium]
MRHVASLRLYIGLFGVAATLPASPISAQQAGTTGSGASAGKTTDGKKQADTTPPKAARPSRDRWLVKTASDRDAHSIDTVPQKTTVEHLLKLPRPAGLPYKETPPAMQEHRAYPVEASVYTVEVDIVSSQLMPDGDYKVTLRGASGETMVMEMPDPAPGFVDPAGLFAKQIGEARTQFDTKFQPDRTAKPTAGHARITGIGYFGRSYGAAEPVGNLIQLHPVLKVEWLPKPTAEFASDASKAKAADKKPAPAPDKSKS